MTGTTAPAQDTWDAMNTRYLGEAVAWLRLRLDRLARTVRDPAADVVETPRPQAPTAVPAAPRRSFWDRVAGNDGRGPDTAPRGHGRPAPGSPSADGELAAAAASLEEYEASDAPPALVGLARRFGLSAFERDVLLLCLGVEFDTGLGGRCAAAQGDPTAPFPTFALAFAAFDDGTWDALSPDRPLRYWRLLEVRSTPLRPLTASALVADERIVNYCKGLNTLDSRMADMLAPFPFPADAASTVPASHEQVIETIELHLRPAAPQPAPVIHLIGPDPPSKHLVAQHVAADMDVPLMRLPLESLAGGAGDLEGVTRLIHREGALFPMAIYIDAHDGPRQEGGDGPEPTLNRLLARPFGIAFLDTRDVLKGLEADAVMLDVRSPTPDEQRQAWATALGTPVAGLPATLAGQFDLSAPVITRIGRSVRALGDATPDDTAKRAWDGCLAHIRPQLDLLAERIEPRAAWDDLVLPDAEKALLRTITDQVRQRSTVYHTWGVADGEHRGLGITALFTGESGTGKTMAAEVLGRELNLNLYRIDLSAVVSKYIGETEKNLRRLFDAADHGGTMLFFDEADALFGKRSEVKDSHDRYANIEINYLLQRMEAYRGLAILATNMKGALDQAFTRRLRFIVTFPFPGAAERERIWRHTFAAGVPVGDLDHGRLARIGLSGGSIRNASMNAAFLAAAAKEQVVTMPLVMDAIRMELQKLNRPFDEADLALPVEGERP